MTQGETITEALRDWLERVEILAAGVEARRARAAAALSEGDLIRARAEALAVLDEVPRARAALAVWADSAGGLGLDEEAIEALTRLVDLLPFRADLWLRLARYRKQAREGTRIALERAVEAGAPVGAVDEARGLLADQELDEGDPAAALRWLDEMSLPSQRSRHTLLRRAEALLDAGDRGRAHSLLGDVPPADAADARAWCVWGRFYSASDDPRAAHALERALLLGAPRAEAAVTEYVGRCRDAVVIARFRDIAQELGLAAVPAWRAAFATAEGRAEDALAALGEAARDGGTDAARRQYLRRAFDLRHAEAFSEAVQLVQRSGDRLDPSFVALARALGAPTRIERLRGLEAVTEAPARHWAVELRAALAEQLCPSSAPAAWHELLPELARAALRLSDVAALREVESLTRDLERPIRAAIVGEFNAGKSTLVNALLGEPVAPVGVLPTTATAHHLVWAPDRFARIALRGGAAHPERVVPHAALRATLAEVGPAAVLAVHIYAPLELLRWVELVDTPGFNAPEPAHAREAEDALSLAHVLIWLTDATQPVKRSELDRIIGLCATGLPLVVLVNKTDRLDPEAVRLVTDHVARSLDEARLSLLAPPLGLSAQRALEDEGMGRGEWQAVQRLIDESVVRESAALRDRAMRRRAHRLARTLGATAQSIARQSVRDADEIEGVERRLIGQREAVQRRLVEEWRRTETALQRGLAVVRQAGADAAIARFVGTRVRELVAEPCAKALAGELGLEGDAARRFRDIVERVSTAVLAAAELAGREGASSHATELLAAYTVDETLRALRDQREPWSRPPEAGLADTLGALAIALMGPGGGSTESVLEKW